MRHCPTCGANVLEQADICAECGMDLMVTGSEATANPSSTPSAGAEAASSPMVAESSLATTPIGLARLTLKRAGVVVGEPFAIGERALIGRFDAESGPVDVDLGPFPEATYISRHHAEIWRDPAGQWLVKDLDSSNGTFVRPGGQGQFSRVAGEQAIDEGDEVAFGNARFDFHINP